MEPGPKNNDHNDNKRTHNNHNSTNNTSSMNSSNKTDIGCRVWGGVVGFGEFACFTDFKGISVRRR